MKMVPTVIHDQMCKIIIESTYFSSERSALVNDLDITHEELDEVIQYAKKQVES